MAIYIDDRELVAAHQAGDSEAFDELVREHRLPLLAHASRKLRCDAAAQDALQETLVRAYKALPRFNGEYRLGPWLHRIMANVCVDESHRRRRDSEKTDKFASQSARSFESPSAEEELGLNFDDATLRNALEDLSDPHREALVLRVVDELEYAEVAERVGVSEANARARVSRARSAIRAAVKGVAMLPAMIAVLLKRGEKAAAAATASSAVTTTAAVTGGQTASATLPAIAEVTTVASQASVAALPIITKAAVGVGLVAAVFTPTSDSALHQAVANMGLTEFGQDTDISLNEADAGIIASGASLPADPSDLSIAIDDNQRLDLQSQGSRVTASSLETLTPSVEGSTSSVRVEASEVARDQQAMLLPADPNGEKSRVSVADLSVTPRGTERFELTGPFTLLSADRSHAGVLQSGSLLRMAPGSAAEELRIEALLTLELESGQTVEIQLAGLAEDTRPNLDISGIYKTNSAGDLPLGATGWFSAQLNLEGVTGARSLVLDLES